LERACGLAWWQTLQLGDEDLDHETAARLKMLRGVAEARNLFVLGE
jgi:hypothetical protein